EAMQREPGFGKIRTQQLRGIVFGAPLEITARVQPLHVTWFRAPSAARALCSRRTTDRHRLERRKARPRRVTCHTGEPRINHCSNTFDRERRLSNICRQYDFALTCGLHGARLLCDREIAVQWQ